MNIEKAMRQTKAEQWVVDKRGWIIYNGLVIANCNGDVDRARFIVHCCKQTSRLLGATSLAKQYLDAPYKSKYGNVEIINMLTENIAAASKVEDI